MSERNHDHGLKQELIALIQKDLEITKRALDKIKIIAPNKSYALKIAEDFLEMAKAYYQDAVHFRDKGDLPRAVACVNYAHAWLDSGARLGVFEVDEDDKLFTLAE